MRIWGICLVVVVVLATAASAGAATRYAAPNGGALGECTQATACSLPRAFEVVKAGEEVIVEPGTYPTLTKRITPASERVAVHGEFDAPMPVVHSTLKEAIRIDRSGDTLKWMEIVSEGPEANPLECNGGTGIERVRAIAVGTRAIGVEMFGPCDVADSLVVSRGAEAKGVYATVTPQTSEETIRNSTVIGSGPGTIGIDAETGGEEGQVFLEVSNTIASGDFLDLVSSGTATVFAENVNFGSSLAERVGAIKDQGGNQTAPPLFVDAANGNYAEAAGSPTIDAGVIIPAYATPAVDLAGNLRAIGGGTDIGAYEFVPPPPAPPGGESGGGTKVAPPAPPVVVSHLKLTPSAFHVAGKGANLVAKGHAPTGAKIAYTLSAAAKVTFTVARKASGRKAGKGCAKTTRANAAKPKCTLFVPVAGSFSAGGVAGANTASFSGLLGGKPLAPGKYQLTAEAGGSSAAAGFKILE
jgi:hypothetical protein